MRKLILLIILFTPLPVICQQSPAELNEKAIATRQYDPGMSFIIAKRAYLLALEQKDTSQIALSLKNMGVALYYQAAFDSASIYYEKALKYYTAINDSIGMSAAANNLGLVCIDLSRIDDAEKYLKLSLKIDYLLKDTAGLAYGLNNIGQVYQIKGMHREAADMYMKSAEYELLYGNEFGAAESWINVGVVLTELSEYEKSNSYLKKSLDIAIKYDDPILKARALNNMGDNYTHLGRFDLAETYIRKSIAIREKYKEYLGLTNSYLHLANMFQAMEMTDSAEFYLFKSISLCMETDNYRVAVLALMEKGRLLNTNGSYKESNDYLLNALELAQNMEYDPILNDIYSLLSTNYSKLGDYESAWKYEKMISKHSVKETEVETVREIPQAETETEQTKFFSIQNVITGVLAAMVGVLLFLLLVRKR